MLRLLGCLSGAVVDTLRGRWRRGPLRPTWSFRFEVIVRFLRRDWEATSAWPLPKVRAALDTRPYPSDVVAKVASRETSLGGVRSRWLVPPRARDDVFLFFLHGGSFAFGSAWTTHADLAARLALATGITVVAPDVRLAPEHPFPAAHEDALAAYEALAARGSVVVAGDSSGGNLALALQCTLRDRGEQPVAAVLVSPWADLLMRGASYAANEPFDFGTRDTLVTHAAAYAGDMPLDDPRVSPAFADLHGLAPTLVVVGDAELLRDDVLALARNLERAGVDVTSHVAIDMPHDPPVFAAFHPNGQRAMDAIAAFVRARV